MVYTGALSSLKRFKDDVREVREGHECGIGIENFNDIKVGDRIESFRMEEIKRDPPAGRRRRGGVIVGIQVWELHLPGCHSLKEKRGTLKPLTGGAPPEAQRVGGGDRPPGPLAARRDRLRGRGVRAARRRGDPAGR